MTMLPSAASDASATISTLDTATIDATLTMTMSGKNQKDTWAATTTRRIPSSIVSAGSSNLLEYLKENLDDASSDNTNRQRRELQQTTGYVPGFEGYVSIAFSVHVPFWQLMLDDLEQERLESLVMLFLCSQGVEMVVSTDPTSLFPVCPFNDIGSDVYKTQTATAMKRSATNAVAAIGDDDQAEPIIVWNLPKFETATMPFDEEEKVLNMATNKTFGQTLAPHSNEPQQYYTQLNVTYPVYQWGSEDPSVAGELQDEFDTSVIDTGTLDSLLPWPNAQTAPIGEEPYVFWDAPLPVEPGAFDTTIPSGVGSLLQSLGVSLLVINTLVVVALSIVARIQSKRAELLQKQRKEEYRQRMTGVWSNGKDGSNGNEYLDTEAGVSAILLESSQYALTKSGGYSVGSDTGVEVIGTSMRSLSSSPKEKENKLLARAKLQTKPSSYMTTILSTDRASSDSPAWYTGTHSSGNALGNYNEDDEEAENLRADLQILNLSAGTSSGSAGKNGSTFSQTR